MKRLSVIGSFSCLVSGCVNNLPQGYLGGDVTKAEIVQNSYSSFKVEISRQDSSFSKEKVRSVLGRIGIEACEIDNRVIFSCSRAELIGFLTMISENGTVTTKLGSHEIVCGRIGFPMKVRGALVIVAPE
jgi:hypothetical protein